MKASRMITAAIAAIILTVLIFFIISLFFDNEEENGTVDPPPDEEIEEPDEDENGDDNDDQVDISPLTNERAQTVMTNSEQAFQTLIDDTDENNYLTSFDSEDEVRIHLEDVMSAELTTWMLDTYIEEREEGAFLVPTETPIWLDHDEDFTLRAMSLDHYLIIQERSNELIGNVEMTYHAEWREEDDKWVLTDIESEQLEQDLSAEEVGEEIIRAIDEREMTVLATHAHEERGVLFSPYVYVDEDEDLIFDQDQIANFSDDDEEYYWGDYDGSAHDIELTPEEYFDEFLDVEMLIDPDQVYINEYNQHGNVLNNHDEVFPDATVVEFHYEGSEGEGSVDWFSVHLVFEENENGVWRLIAIVSDQWTI
ncbi:hypothetical protein J2T56_001998 [Natronobacillus azotifigens]|uniref:Uncharacterized protein n=1 Tax=Natronobacillus azotifigens TaxID=472978 RepID=A0A9J6RE07_9BACI|nr:hypothetical protein [Natronobacillus azotifigens]MCZ0703791.1 hypothetical protein [Natronobacillus azotifigens]